MPAEQIVTGVFTSMFPPAKLGGGPIRTLDALVASFPDTHTARVLTSDRDLGDPARLDVPANQWVPRKNALVYYASADRLRSALRALAALRAAKPQVLYFNSFFDPVFSILPQLVWRLIGGRATVRLLAPRGEFSVGALAIKSSKKALFIRMYRLLRLDSSVIWHASAAEEAEDIRRVFGAGSRIVVREDETSLPDQATIGGSSESSTLRAVFLSRIVPKKGLLVLLAALQSVETPLDLDIVGAEEDREYAARCHETARRLPAHVTVRFLGPADPDEVRETFQDYDVFLIPTAGENFGHVFAEALSVGCPVMTTPFTPWTTRINAGGGVVVDSLDPALWAEHIERYAKLSRAQWRANRQRAAAAYDSWRAEPKGDHVMTLLSALTGAVTTRP